MNHNQYEEIEAHLNRLESRIAHVSSKIPDTTFIWIILFGLLLHCHPRPQTETKTQTTIEAPQQGAQEQQVIDKVEK